MNALDAEQSQQNTDRKFRESEHVVKEWSSMRRNGVTVTTRWGLARARKHIEGHVLLYNARDCGAASSVALVVRRDEVSCQHP